MSNTNFWHGCPTDNIRMDVFDRHRISMKEIHKSVAKNIIIKHHYSKSWPAAQICLGFYIDDVLNGVVVFGTSVGSHMKNSLPSENYLELQRLYSFDWAGKNMESYMISQSIKHIKINYPHIDIIISFADPQQNHAGTIYQATNWLYCGISGITGGYQFKFNGKWEHPRSTGARLGTRDSNKIFSMYPDIEYRKQPRKHRYIYLLANNKKHKKQLLDKLQYKILPYPKNNQTKVEL